MAGSLSLLHHRLSCQGLVFNLMLMAMSKKKPTFETSPLAQS